MDQYADVISDNATVEDYRRISSYYQRTGHHFKAGTFFLKAKDYEQALFHFLHCSRSMYPDGENIDMAIKVVSVFFLFPLFLVLFVCSFSALPSVSHLLCCFVLLTVTSNFSCFTLFSLFSPTLLPCTCTYTITCNHYLYQCCFYCCHFDSFLGFFPLFLQVGEAKLDSITAQLHSYLMGEDDDSPKEAKYLFHTSTSFARVSCSPL